MSGESVRGGEDGTDDGDPPKCPRCGAPVAAVATVGPTEGVAAPCGCRVAPGSITDSRLE